jgi:hypothetical protein
VIYEGTDWPPPSIVTNLIDINATHKEQRRQWDEQMTATSPVANQLDNSDRGPLNANQRKHAMNARLARMEADRERALIGDCDLWAAEATRRYR